MKNTAENRGDRPASSSALVRIVIWSAVFCILTGLFIVGMVGHDLQLGWTGFTVSGSTVLRYDDDGYTVGNGTSNATVTDLSVEWVTGNVTVIAAEGDEITITEDYGGDRDAFRLRWKVEDGELTIKFCKSGRINRKEDLKKNLTVAIPAVMLESMDEVEVLAVSGHISYTGNADKLSLEAVAGDMTVTGDIGELEMDGVDGEVSFRGGVRRGDFNCVNANVTMYLDMAANLDFDQVDGDVRLFLSDEITGFSAEISSLKSELIIDGFDDVRRDGKTAHWGDGGLRIGMDGVSNKLEIKKATKD